MTHDVLQRIQVFALNLTRSLVEFQRMTVACQHVTKLLFDSHVGTSVECLLYDTLLAQLQCNAHGVGHLANFHEDGMRRL